MNDTTTGLDSPLDLAGEAVTRDGGVVRLVGSECRDCGTRVFPPTAVCPACLSENMARLPLSPQGTLYSWSVVHAAPRGWTLPFVAGYVDLPEGVRVFAHIVGADGKALGFDMPVEATVAVLGRDDEGRPIESYAFRPVDAEDRR